MVSSYRTSYLLRSVATLLSAINPSTGTINTPPPPAGNFTLSDLASRVDRNYGIGVAALVLGLILGLTGIGMAFWAMKNGSRWVGLPGVGMAF